MVAINILCFHALQRIGTQIIPKKCTTHLHVLVILPSNIAHISDSKFLSHRTLFIIEPRHAAKNKKNVTQYICTLTEPRETPLRSHISLPAKRVKENHLLLLNGIGKGCHLHETMSTSRIKQLCHQKVLKKNSDFYTLLPNGCLMCGSSEIRDCSLMLFCIVKHL